MFDIKANADQLKGIEDATAFVLLDEFLVSQRDQVVAFLASLREAFPNLFRMLSESVNHAPEQMLQRFGPLAGFQRNHYLSIQCTVTQDQ